jgi:AAA ATPase domain
VTAARPPHFTWDRRRSYPRCAREWAFWNAARSSILVSGEAGAGKTVLVRAFADRVGPRVRVTVSHCDPLDIRHAAADTGLPVDRIVEVRVLDPYFYGGAA